MTLKQACECLACFVAWLAFMAIFFVFVLSGASVSKADVCDSWASAMRYEFIASDETRQAMEQVGTCYSESPLRTEARPRIMWRNGVWWVQHGDQDQGPDGAGRDQGILGRGGR